MIANSDHDLDNELGWVAYITVVLKYLQIFLRGFQVFFYIYQIFSHFRISFFENFLYACISRLPYFGAKNVKKMSRFIHLNLRY